MNIYHTSYCNHGHVLETGKPVEHECYVLPVKALAAELAGDYTLAADLLGAKPLQIHRGLRGRALRSSVPAPSEVLRLEEDVIKLCTALHSKKPKLQDRDYYGTLHTNLLALARELEKHFDFKRES